MGAFLMHQIKYSHDSCFGSSLIKFSALGNSSSYLSIYPRSPRQQEKKGYSDFTVDETKIVSKQDNSCGL